MMNIPQNRPELFRFKSLSWGDAKLTPIFYFTLFSFSLRCLWIVYRSHFRLEGLPLYMCVVELCNWYAAAIVPALLLRFRGEPRQVLPLSALTTLVTLVVGSIVSAWFAITGPLTFAYHVPGILFEMVCFTSINLVASLLTLPIARTRVAAEPQPV